MLPVQVLQRPADRISGMQSQAIPPVLVWVKPSGQASTLATLVWTR